MPSHKIAIKRNSHKNLMCSFTKTVLIFIGNATLYNDVNINTFFKNLFNSVTPLNTFQILLVLNVLGSYQQVLLKQ